MVLHQERNRQSTAFGEDHTGIPAQLKKQVEDSTALELDDVRIHYNSGKPAELDALAYTQGTQVYLGPGQERHLPHELGHVIQQKLGMVRPDTRHESGAMLNTDQALERQADRIGAGGERIALSCVRRCSEPTVQRMSVLENRRDGVDLHIARYKRSGWRAVQQLRNYLTEECIKRISLGQLEELSSTIHSLKTEELYEKMNRVTGGMGIFEYSPEFQRRFQEKMAAAGAAGGSLEEWYTTAKELGAVLEQCSAAVGDMEGEERASLNMAGLEKKGRYHRLEPGQGERADVDPYFNCRKAALHCIALKVSSIRDEVKVGPHIALSVIGRNIYVATNSHQYNRPLQSDEDLAQKVNRAISEINQNEIGGMMGPGSQFEQGTGIGRTPPTEEIYQYIQQLRGYTVRIVDALEFRESEPGELGPIHGEMAIMDYLQNNAEGQQVIAARGAKLDEIEQLQDGERRRVIWIGGTKVDCITCHGHFGEINASDSLGRNYVVSSKEVGNDGDPYRHTEFGTHLAKKKEHTEEIRAKDRGKLRRAQTKIVASFPPDFAPV